MERYGRDVRLVTVNPPVAPRLTLFGPRFGFGGVGGAGPEAAAEAAAAAAEAVADVLEARAATRLT